MRKITLSYLYSGEMIGFGNSLAITPGVNCASLPVAGFAGCAFFIASADALGLKSRGRVLLRKYLAFIQVWPNLSWVYSFTLVMPCLSRNSI